MIVTSVVRALQLLFGVVVLGLSITAIKWQFVGNAPATTVFGAVCGAFGVLAALIGAAAIFIDAIPDIIMAGVDALASVLFLAGGIVSLSPFSPSLTAAILTFFVGFRCWPQGCPLQRRFVR